MSRDEVQRHLELADEKLEAARLLLADGHFRDAVGRAYFAMFHAGMALVRTKGPPPRTHRGLALVLGREFVSPGLLSEEEIEYFRAEQHIREAGDYDLWFTLDEAEASEAIEKAESFVRRVEALLR